MSRTGFGFDVKTGLDYTTIEQTAMREDPEYGELWRARYHDLLLHRYSDDYASQLATEYADAEYKRRKDDAK